MITSSTVFKDAEFKEVKADNPTILVQLAEHIEANCIHGTKSPIAVEIEGKVNHLCCIKCAVDYIFKDRVRGKITVR